MSQVNPSGAPRLRILSAILVAMSLASVASAQSSGLVAAYSFDEGTGTSATDSSGNGNRGTLVNGTTWSTTAKFGRAANFDGVDDRIDVADSNSLDLTTGMTLEAWVRPTANSGYRTVVLKEISGELAYSLYAADSDHGTHPSGWVRVASASHYADGTGALPLSSWSHVAVTYNGSALVYYVNGVQTRSTAVSGPIMTSGMPLRIGSNTIWGEYFQGQIDEVRVYNRALSASEIQVDMVTPISGAADTAAPTVAVTAPAGGATVSGTITLSATASDNVGVVGVQFKIDGANVGSEDTSSPYSAAWDTNAAGSGSHQVTAVARDAAGNSTTSAAVTVSVSNADAQAPTVALTAPASGATISGTTTLSANASDNVGVVGVQFRVDGTNVGAEDSSAPYSLAWSSLTVANGTHSLTAVARDAAGNTTISSARSVTVSNGGGDRQAPSVSMTSPAGGATVSGTVNLTASASDNVGVVGVQFAVDGVNVSTEDTSSPYRRSWDSSSASAGTHSLTAIARDAAGNVTTSAPVSVTVNSGDTVAPTVSFSSPASGATVRGTVTVSANASDNVGVVGVQFKLDGSNLGAEDTSSPYSVSWSTTGASNGSHTLTATARDAAGRTSTATRTVTVSNAGGGGGGISLTVDGSERYQTIDGFGVSANSASWNNGELKPALDMLTDQNGSNIWRVIIEMADWEAANDDADPNNFNWTYYNTIYSSPRFEELWATMSYLNQKGVTSLLMLNFMGRGPSWMGGASLPTNMEDEWVETVASVAYYARNNRHIQFGLFAPNNEPDWDGIEGIQMSQSQYTRVMRKLAQKLDAIGLGDIRLVGPDTAQIGTVNTYLPSMMGDATLMAKVDHFAFHDYYGDSGGADGIIKNSAYPNRNFWITEVSNFSDALAHLGQGPAAILVWDGYDSVYNHAILAGRGSTPPNDAGNGPAMLAYSTSTHLYTPRTPFYQFAQLFRFVPPGSVLVDTTQAKSGVTIYAFTHPVSGRVTLVGSNTNSSSVTYSGRLLNLPTVPSFEMYHTSASVNLQRDSDVAVSNGSFTFVAPAGSVFTLNYSGPVDTVPPTVSVTAPQAGATVSGTVSVSSSTAADNIGVHGVQFKVDGVLVGVEDTMAPYSVQWNTAGIANGTHSLVAVARDESGNVTTSAPVSVTVSN